MNGNKISKGIESLVGSIYYYHYVTDTVLSIGYNFCKSYEADFYDFSVHNNNKNIIMTCPLSQSSSPQCIQSIF